MGQFTAALSSPEELRTKTKTIEEYSSALPNTLHRAAAPTKLNIPEQLTSIQKQITTVNSIEHASRNCALHCTAMPNTQQQCSIRIRSEQIVETLRIINSFAVEAAKAFAFFESGARATGPQLYF